MNNYRIIKLTLQSNEEVYVVQKLTRFFWVGPKIWESYQEIYDGNWTTHDAWTWFIRMGDYFYSYKAAEEKVKALKQIDSYSSKYKKLEIIKNI